MDSMFKVSYKFIALYVLFVVTTSACVYFASGFASRIFSAPFLPVVVTLFYLGAVSSITVGLFLNRGKSK